MVSFRRIPILESHSVVNITTMGTENQSSAGIILNPKSASIVKLNLNHSIP